MPRTGEAGVAAAGGIEESPTVAAVQDGHFAELPRYDRILTSAEGKAAYYRQREHMSLAARLKILSGILGAAQSVETERTRKIEHMCQTLSVALYRGQLVLRLSRTMSSPKR